MRTEFGLNHRSKAEDTLSNWAARSCPATEWEVREAEREQADPADSEFHRRGKRDRTWSRRSGVVTFATGDVVHSVGGRVGVASSQAPDGSKSRKRMLSFMTL
jgi:hypothetical protein